MFTTIPKAIPSNWVLLDSCSTINVFSSSELLKNIRRSEKRMKIACQSGVSSTNLVGDLEGFPEPLWFTPDGIANVLSLASVRKHFPVKYITKGSRARFVVEMEGRKISFNESHDGLYYQELSMKEEGTSLVTTVRDQRERYTNREYQKAKQARRL